MNKKEEKALTIPQNCSPLPYIIEGFTGKELAYLGGVFTVAAIIGVFIFTTTQKSFLAVSIVTIVMAVAIVFFRRDQYSENCVDKIKLLIEYHKAPKSYQYEYVNIYEKNQKGNLNDESNNRSK